MRVHAVYTSGVRTFQCDSRSVGLSGSAGSRTLSFRVRAGCSTDELRILSLWTLLRCSLHLNLHNRFCILQQTLGSRCKVFLVKIGVQPVNCNEYLRGSGGVRSHNLRLKRALLTIHLSYGPVPFRFGPCLSSRFMGFLVSLGVPSSGFLLEVERGGIEPLARGHRFTAG